MIQAAIYDMDGLLVDTEWLWQDAELQVFPPLGVPLTREMCLQTMGMRVEEVVSHWNAQYPFSKSEEDVVRDIVDAVTALILEKAELKEGVMHSIQLMQSRGYALAVASSSPSALIETVLRRFGLWEAFPLFRSAEDEAYGKPHPAVYLRTAEALGIAPTACLALEDSFNGLLSAKSARMHTLVVPDPAQFDDPKWVIADLKLKSLAELKENMLERS